MSFTEHSLQRLSSTSVGKDDPAVNYSATWRLHGWDAPSTPPTFSDVYSYLRSSSAMPYHGRAFQHETFRDATAKCVSIEPEPVSGSQDSWDVRAIYESTKPPKQERPDNQQGDATEDPFQWRRECNVSWSQTSIGIEKAIFRGFSRPIGNRFLRPGRVGALVNSALQPLDVQHLMELDTQTITISKYVPQWNNQTAQFWIGAVNKADFDFQLRDLNGRFSFDALTLKVRNFGATSDFINGKTAWKQTIELSYNPLGWRLSVLDSGFGPRQMLSDRKYKSTTGERISAADVQKNGGVGVFTDENGNPTSVPRLLNGDGEELPAGQDPVFLIYQIYEREANFGQLERLF